MVTETCERNLKEIRRYVTVKHVPLSDLPYRLTRKRDGLIIGSFPTEAAARQWMERLEPETYRPKTTRKKIAA